MREDPASVNRRMNDGGLPLETALHVAARWNREEAARILIRHGADPNVLAGNGQSPLDLADECGSSAVAALLEQHGGRRTTS